MAVPIQCPPPVVFVLPDTIHSSFRAVADTSITRSELVRLRGMETLAAQASGLFTQLRAEIIDCQNNRAAIYAISRKNSQLIGHGLQIQQELLKSPPPTLLPCPPAPKAKTWVTYLIGGLSLLTGVVVGSKL